MAVGISWRALLAVAVLLQVLLLLVLWHLVQHSSSDCHGCHEGVGASRLRGPEPPIKPPDFGEGAPTIQSKTKKTDALHLQSSDILPDDATLLRLSPCCAEPVVGRWWATLGITSVKRKKGEYMRDTLLDLFQKMTRVEDVVLVVHLADSDEQWCRQTADWIFGKFPLTVQRGHLHIIKADASRYPPLPYDSAAYPVNFWDYPEFNRTPDPGGFNDSAARVMYRSKQNVDVAFLVHYMAHGVSSSQKPDYIIMLEDDIIAADRFTTSAIQTTEKWTDKGRRWRRLDFSGLGYIGKLLPFSLAGRLAQFHIQLYDRMPADWVFDRMQELFKLQRVVVRPILFQHVGIFSALANKVQPLKEGIKNFHGIHGRRWRAFLPTNPPACVASGMKSYVTKEQRYSPEHVYVPAKNYEAFRSMLDGFKVAYFWSARAPVSGDHITLEFETPVVLDAVELRFGRQERASQNDFLRSGVLQIGQCSDKPRGFRPPGLPIRGCHLNCCLSAAYQDVTTVDPEAYTLCRRPTCALSDGPVNCLRVKVTAPQEEWLVLDEINILHRQEESPAGSTGELIVNPDADVVTDMEHHWPSGKANFFEWERHVPRRAYEDNLTQWFWATEVFPGSSLVVIFKRPLAMIQEVIVDFGNTGAPADVLFHGAVELGVETEAYKKASHTERHLRSLMSHFCNYTWRVASVSGERRVRFPEGSSEAAVAAPSLRGSVGWRCLRILALEAQSVWMAVSHIRVLAREATANEAEIVSSPVETWAIESD